MKKYLFVAVLAVASLAAYAQPRAVGLSLGGMNAISYQHGLGSERMLNMTLGFDVDGRTDYNAADTHFRMWGHTIQAAITHDWIDPCGATLPWQHRGEWHWYLGVGGAVGYGWHAWVGTVPGNGSTHGPRDWGCIGAAGRIGFEYDFWFPLQLSLDWRPTLGLGLMDNGGGNTTAGFYWEMSCISLGVRYKF